MPGVYAKQMHGEHFDLLVKEVEESYQIISASDYSRLVQHQLASILLLTTEKTKTVIEKFYYAGGFHLFFHILKQTQLEKDFNYLQSVHEIINFFSTLLAVEVDPYDDNVGVLPMLTYFLTERHTYHIDFAWKSDELLLMALFLDSYLKILQINLTPSDVKIIISTLADVLLTFPPQRVVSQAVNILNNPQVCRNIINVFRNSVELYESSVLGRNQIIQCLYGIAIFGLGNAIASDLPRNQVFLILLSKFLPELRCSCQRCEHARRLQKAARDQDEFGVLTVAKAKCEICVALLEGGLIDLLAEFLEQIQLYSKHHRNTSSKIRKCVSLIEHKHFESLTDEMKLEDETLCYIVRLIWLCSWSFENVYRCSILSTKNCLLFVRLLQTLSLSDLRHWFMSRSCAFLPGVQLTVECLCVLLLKAAPAEIAELYPRLQPTLQAILETTSRSVSKVCENQKLGDCEAWNTFIGGNGLFVVTQCAMISVSYLCSEPFDKKVKLKSLKCPLNYSCYIACLNACQSLADTFERLRQIENAQMFIMSLLLSMSLLADGFQYLRCNENLRQFLPPPDAECGFMAASGRYLTTAFQENSETVCLIIKILGSIVISRAEKAIALSLPQK